MKQGCGEPIVEVIICSARIRKSVLLSKCFKINRDIEGDTKFIRDHEGTGEFSLDSPKYFADNSV